MITRVIIEGKQNNKKIDIYNYWKQYLILEKLLKPLKRDRGIWKIERVLKVHENRRNGEKEGEIIAKMRESYHRDKNKKKKEADKDFGYTFSNE